MRLFYALILICGVSYLYAEDPFHDELQHIQQDIVKTQKNTSVLNGASLDRENISYLIQQLTGRIEALEHKVKILEQRKPSVSSDHQNLKKQPVKPVSNAGPASALVSNKASAQAPKSILPKNLQSRFQETPKNTAADQLYQKAHQAFLKDDFDAARILFEQFLTHYASHGLAGHAAYWTGETYYRDKKYQKAATLFLKSYQYAPQGEKTPDALYKLALSLEALHQKDQACKTIRKLLRDYTHLKEPLNGQVMALKEKLGC